jgi:tetratricopeptide (TPR) repeat protein
MTCSRKLVTAAAVLLCFAAGCRRSNDARAREFLERGDRFARNGDDKSAAIEYQNAVRRTPTAVDAHARLAEAAIRLHDVNTATSALLKIAELQPNDLAAQLRAGEAATSAGRFAEARLAFEQALAIDPGHLQATRALAVLHTAAGEHRLAEPYWRALAANPKGDPFALADYYIATGRFDNADRELRPLLDVPERAAGAGLRLALVLRQRRLDRDAESMLDAVLRENRRDAAAWLVRARFRVADRQLDEAAAAYERALAIEPLSMEALSGLTALDLRAKRHAEAVGRLERILARTPDAVPVLVLAAQTYVATGAADRAERALQHAIDVAPETLDAYALLGQLYVGQNRLPEARARFETLAARTADPVPATTMAAMVLEAEHRPAEAQTRYEEILKAHPSAGVAANNLAWIYLEQGRLDDALRYALVAKQAIAQLPQVNDTLGWIYYQRGQIQQAIPLLARSAEMQPQNPLYRQHLEMAYQKAGMTQPASR